MKNRVGLQYGKWIVLAIMWLLSVHVLAKEEGLLPDLQNPGFVEQPKWFKQSFLDIREDIQDAAAENKHVFLYFYQDGCPYCKKLLTLNFAQKAIVDKTRQNFDVIAINMWGDREVTTFNGKTIKEKEFAADLRVMFTPTILMLDKNGDVALRINGYYAPPRFMRALEYVADDHFKKMRFREFMSSNAPIASHGELHQEDYFRTGSIDLSKRSGNKEFLLVLFEQKDCPACDELHSDILKRKDTLDQIKRFDVVQLDMWSDEMLGDTEGTKTSARDWAKKLEVQYAPTFVFFDASGKEVIRMDAYLKSFHIQSVMDYVASKAYLKEPSFQRFIDVRAEHLREQGQTINLME